MAERCFDLHRRAPCTPSVAHPRRAKVTRKGFGLPARGTVLTSGAPQHGKRTPGRLPEGTRAGGNAVLTLASYRVNPATDFPRFQCLQVVHAGPYATTARFPARFWHLGAAGLGFSQTRKRKRTPDGLLLLTERLWIRIAPLCLAGHPSKEHRSISIAAPSAPFARPASAP